MLSAEEAACLIAKDSRNEDVVYPYLIGQELNISPTHRPSKWIINFRDWPLDRKTAPEAYAGPVAEDYPDCLHILEERVRPERTRRDSDGNFVLRKPLPQRWWIYGDRRPELYAKLSQLEWSLAIATAATKYVAFGQVSGRKLYSHAVALIATDNFGIAAALASSIHEVWARKWGGYNLLLLRYAPSNVFDNFPLPSISPDLEVIGRKYYEFRSELMRMNNEGLTATYNRFHDVAETSDGTKQLRMLQVTLDHQVAANYGWSSLDFGHGFHATKQGVRYTISETARRIVLDRLLNLNQERHQEEVGASLPAKNETPSKRKTKSLKTPAGQGKLL